MARSAASVEFDRIRARAVAIGNAPYNDDDFRELLTFLRHTSPQVRRAAASAIGKVIDSTPNIDQMAALPLYFAAIEEKFEQVQQYMLKSLLKCAGRLKGEMIADIADIARNATLKDYVRTAANDVVAAAETEKEKMAARLRHWCSRCKKVITPQEAEIGNKRYGKPYCRHCLDERILEDRNFERDVEAAKKLRTKDGTAVQSQGERRIADYLAAHNIDYVYDERYRICGDVAIRPDFYLPEFDLYIEYWGMEHRDYLARKAEKKFLYQRAGKCLISLDFNDLPHLEKILEDKLSRYFRI